MSHSLLIIKDADQPEATNQQVILTNFREKGEFLAEIII